MLSFEAPDPQLSAWRPRTFLAPKCQIHKIHPSHDFWCNYQSPYLRHILKLEIGLMSCELRPFMGLSTKVDHVLAHDLVKFQYFFG